MYLSICLYTPEINLIAAKLVENHLHRKAASRSICLFTLELILIAVKPVENHFQGK